MDKKVETLKEVEHSPFTGVDFESGNVKPEPKKKVKK